MNLMVLSRFLRPRNVTITLFALLFTGLMYGFAATNSVPGSAAGDGSGTISGYTASAITYTLNAGDPTKIDAIKFTLTNTSGGSAPVTVRAQLSAAGAWYTCSLSGTTWSCDTTGGGGATVAGATLLRVVAAQ
jgi:hypothetical protein